MTAFTLVACELPGWLRDDRRNARRPGALVLSTIDVMDSINQVCGTTDQHSPEQGSRFTADVTKLLAADSFLDATMPQDPEAHDAFCCLTSLLANPVTTGFFHRAHLVEGQLGEVGKCWVDISEPAQPRANGEAISMDPLRAELFAKWYGGPGARRVVEWLNFQAQPSLMRIFWQDNQEEDLSETYCNLVASQVDVSALKTAIAQAKHENGLCLHDLSARALATLQRRFRFDWNDDSLALAYIAWTYIKGFRYVSGLGPHDIYAVHFTREHVFDASAGWGQVQCKAASLFPWGELLTAHLPVLRQAAYAEATLGLRAYTRAHLDSYLKALSSIQSRFGPGKSGEGEKAFKKAMGLTQQFAADGIRTALPVVVADVLIKRIDGFLLASTLIALLGPSLPFLGSAMTAAELYLQIVMLAMSRDAKRSAAECISLVHRRWQIDSSVSEQAEILRMFLLSHGVAVPAE